MTGCGQSSGLAGYAKLDRLRSWYKYVNFGRRQDLFAASTPAADPFAGGQTQQDVSGLFGSGDVPGASSREAPPPPSRVNNFLPWPAPPISLDSGQGGVGNRRALVRTRSEDSAHVGAIGLALEPLQTFRGRDLICERGLGAAALLCALRWQSPPPSQSAAGLFRDCEGGRASVLY